MTGARPGLDKLKMPGPDRDRYFFYCRGRAGILIFIAGAGAGPRLKKNYCRGLGWAEIGIVFLFPGPVFFIAGAGLGFKKILLTGPGFFLLPGPRPGRDRNFFYCRGRD